MEVARGKSCRKSKIRAQGIDRTVASQGLRVKEAGEKGATLTLVVSSELLCLAEVYKDEYPKDDIYEEDAADAGVSQSGKCRRECVRGKRKRWRAYADHFGGRPETCFACLRPESVFGMRMSGPIPL